jgi:chemotaxis signal transduction protein/hemoglobin-like flavoprotein
VSAQDPNTEAEAQQEGSTADRQVVVFRLATERYGVDIGTVREIIRRQTVTHLPSAPDSVEGVLNLRGGVIPVVDLCKRLNLGIAEDTDAGRIIVLDIAGTDIGVFVDEVTEVLRVPRGSISSTSSILSASDATYIDGIAQLDDGLLILLELDEALSADSLRAFRLAEQVVAAATAAATPDEASSVAPSTVDADATGDAHGAEHAAGTAAADPVIAGEPDAEPRLPLDVELVKSTFEAIAPRGEELVETFYERLLEQHPGVAPLFEHVDMAEQRAKLLSALATVVASLSDLETLVPHLQRLGERHVGYGAEPAHYDAVGAVLLECIAEIAGDAWSAEAEQAWAQAYGVASNVMIEAAEALVAREEIQAAA